MSEQRLASEDLKRHYIAQIDKGNTFETHGVSVQVAKDYLDTPEGAVDQTMQAVRQYDEQQAQRMSLVHAQNAQWGQQVQQEPMPGVR